MQSENFDKKIRDSLSQRPPGNEDPQWDKMETLLDKHLPREKKDNRRILFILFLFLLLGGGVFIIWKNNNGNKQDISSNSSPTKNGQQQETGKDKAPSNTTSPNANNSSSTEKQPDQSSITTEVNPDQRSTQQQANTPIKKYADPKNGPSIEFSVTDAGVTKKKKPGKDQLNKDNNVFDKTVTEIERPKDVEVSDESSKTNIDKELQKQNEVSKEKESQNIVAGNKPEEKKPEGKSELTSGIMKTESKKQKKGSSFLNNLFFTVSAGPDFSMVGFDNAGKTRLAVGAGIGYQVSKNFSIRTGFYSARKIYTAAPEDYDPPANFWAWYPNLEKVDANCKVYEIPITIDYTFGNNKKQSWFASAGVSSLIMKEEKYDYLFKPNYSPTYVTYSKTFNNENKHLFSILDISGGYRRNINKNLSIQAEPYMKFAMSGVGYGKVKLNSGGVLVSAIIKPFAKK